jgi:type II secretory pathway predicted ATPase ExeA
MGEVYRVRDDATGKELALKRLRRIRRMGSELPPAQFEREYHTLAQLDHPGVIKVYDYGVDDEGAYYTMELLQGEDLRKRDIMPWREACRVLSDLASTLAVLHSRRWLHRDLSPRNVMICQDGSTKLIDFGAMAPMGIARALLGTAPLVPPEAVQLQALDGRADLYSLGALGYRLLTGRHAYPARTFAQLRDLWRSAPPSPAKLVPDLPPALCALVLELLSLERAARPGTASEVVERLSALTGSTDRAGPDVKAAYLAIPKLVGRSQALFAARKQLVRSLRGRGSGLLIEGESGVGRSRFLDVCVLEAKLLGATVLRADPDDAQPGDYGVAGALGQQLQHALPDLAVDAARLRRSLLASVVRSLAEPDAPAPVSSASFERRHLQTALRDWFRAVSRNTRIVIAIDDLERIDEPSAALLAALVHRSERRSLTVIATMRRDASPTQAAELLKQIAARIELQPLNREETEALVQSVFGQTRNIAAVAERVHELSQGYPRQVMELCESLVSSGSARYAAGAWTLPERLTPTDLPPSIDAALWQRLARLDADAQLIARALSVTEPEGLSLGQHALLIDGVSPARAFRAFGDLMAAGILQTRGERYHFANQRWRELLAAAVAPAELRQFHARLAALAEDGGDVISRAHHLMHCGQEERAIEILLERREQGDVAYSEKLVAVLDAAVAASERLHLPLLQQLKLRIWLVAVAGLTGRHDLYLLHADVIFPSLMEQSGLRDFNALGLPDPEQRLMSALALASARRDALPESERAWAPADAMRELCRLSLVGIAVSWMTLDPKLLDRVPSMSAFAGKSVLVAVLELSRVAWRHAHAGRMAQAREIWGELLVRIEHGNRAEADHAMQRRGRLGALYVLASWEAMHGRPEAFEFLGELREQPGERANAWRLQATYHLMQGDVAEAQACQRRAELLSLQDGAGQVYPGTGLLNEAMAYALLDDLDGLKQLVDVTRGHAERFPHWRPMLQFVECHCRRLRGDIAEALQLAESMVSLAPPGSHLGCARFASAHVWLSSAAGNLERAATLGLNYLQVFRDQQCQLRDCFDLARATAEALALTGRAPEAVSLAEATIDALQNAKIQGIALGCCYETRARVALAMRDKPSFVEWAERCAAIYTRYDNRALSAKYGRLLQQARSEGWVDSEQIAAPVEAPSNQSSDELEGTQFSRMAECLNASERARCALLIMLEHSGAREGHLYAFVEGRLARLASVSETEPGPGLAELLERYVAAELTIADITATSSDGDEDEEVLATDPDPLLRVYQPVLLAAVRDGERTIAAVAALARTDGYEPPPPAVLAVLAASLLDHQDVDATTVVA